MPFKKGDPNINRQGRIQGSKNKQTILREKMESKAEDVVDMLHDIILHGTLDGEDVPKGMRVDLIKNFLPYVLPTLKSVEIINDNKEEVQPLVINVAPIVPSQSTDDPSTTNNMASPQDPIPLEDLSDSDDISQITASVKHMDPKEALRIALEDDES